MTVTKIIMKSFADIFVKTDSNLDLSFGDKELMSYFLSNPEMNFDVMKLWPSTLQGVYYSHLLSLA